MYPQTSVFANIDPIRTKDIVNTIGFPSFPFPLLLMMASMLAVIVYRRKQAEEDSSTNLIS